MVKTGRFVLFILNSKKLPLKEQQEYTFEFSEKGNIFRVNPVHLFEHRRHIFYKPSTNFSCLK